MASFHVHPDAAAWAPKEPCLAMLQAEFPFDLDVAIWPRFLVGSVTGRSYLAPYAFRARTVGRRVDLFADPTEHQASMCWLLAHELAHQELMRHPEVGNALTYVRPADLDPVSDDFHSVDPEERWCDGRATRLVGARYDRAWWRERVLAATR